MDTGTILDMGTTKATSRVATITIIGAVIAMAGVVVEARSGEGSGEEDGIER
jgi:hypothetical protein